MGYTVHVISALCWWPQVSYHGGGQETPATGAGVPDIAQLHAHPCVIVGSAPSPAQLA